VRRLRECSRGTHGRALAAHRAVRGIEGQPHGRCHDAVEAPVLRTDGTDLLDVATFGHAPTAEDALGRITRDRRRDVEIAFLELAVEVLLGDAEVEAKLLELAGLIARAGHAIPRVIRDDEVVDKFASVTYALAVRMDDHALVHLDHARDLEVSCTLHLDDADATRPDGMDLLVSAEAGYPDADKLGRLHDGGILRCLRGNSVDRKSNHV